MRSFRIAQVIAVVLGALLLAPASAPAQGSAAWFYCALMKSPYGDPTFYSSVFRANRATYQVGIQNAFNSYVSARHDPDAISGATCFGPFDGYQEAADRENDAIAGDRRAGRRVVLTLWVYRGD